MKTGRVDFHESIPINFSVLDTCAVSGELKTRFSKLPLSTVFNL